MDGPPKEKELDHIIEPLRKHAVPVKSLHLDPANANTHPEKNMQAIIASLREFGQRQVIIARKGTNTVIAGNGRLMAAHALGWEEIACVFVEDDDITAMRYAIADNRTSELSEWDGEVLSQLLTTIQDDFGSLEGTGFDTGDLDELLSDLGESGKGLDDSGGHYTDKIKIPVYEPKGEKPAISELFCDERPEALIKRIEAAGLDEELSSFLIHGARRFTEFNYRKIADYYAHSPAEVQDIMESLALVIVDYDRAIEEGFIKLSKRLAELAGEEEDA